MSGRKKAKSKNGEVELPDLFAMFDEFFDAWVLVRVACRVMEECEDDNYGPAILALRQCVGALTEVSDKFQDAATRFGRFHNPGPVVGVLYLGVQVLDIVSDQLEEAVTQLLRLSRTNAGVTGSAS